MEGSCPMVLILLSFSIVRVWLRGILWAFFADFHKNGCFEKSLNAIFITLLPKVAGAEDIYKFRLISLVGSVYKILAKVLASRLRSVIGKVGALISMRLWLGVKF